MSTRYANSSWNPSDVNDSSRSCFPWASRNSFSSSLISYTRANILPFDNHRTDVWNSRVSWFESMCLHSLANNLVLTALVLTKLTACMIIASSSFIVAGRVLEARASLWITQWDPTALGLFCFILAINPLRDPSIAGAPSVQTPTSFSHFIPLLSKNAATNWNISSALVVVFPLLLKEIRQSEHTPTTETIGQHQLSHHIEWQKRWCVYLFENLTPNIFCELVDDCFDGRIRKRNLRKLLAVRLP